MFKGHNLFNTVSVKFAGAAIISIVFSILFPVGIFAFGGGLRVGTNVVSTEPQSLLGSGVFLNEVVVDTPDPASEPCEYIEVRGPAGTQAPNNLFFLSVDGDSGQFGVVNYLGNLTGSTFGSNGTITIISNSDVCAGRTYPAGTTILEANSVALGFGAETFLLAISTNPSQIFEGQDLDVNNDGVLDTSFGLTPVDGFGWVLNATFNRVYGGAPILVDSGGTDLPDAATRFEANNTPLSVAAWYYGELAGPNGNSTTYTAPLSPNFPACGALTPGAPNALVGCSTPSPTPSTTATNTPTVPPTNTPTAVATNTATNTPTATSTSTSTSTPTWTPTGTATNTPISTATATATGTPTGTATVTGTATNTPTRTATITPSATPTNTPTPSNTATNTPANTPTSTSTNTPANTPTNTATSTPTRTATNTPTSTATGTATNTSTPTPTPLSVFANSTAICTTLGAAGAPYPSNITVANGPIQIDALRVTLFDVFHQLPDNMDFLLVGPNGQEFVLMADAGGSQPLNSPGVTLTFSDSAGQVLPDSAPLTTGTFEPTNWETPVSNFPAPAPPGPYNEPGSLIGGTGTQTLGGNFRFSNSNGTWSLYMRDDGGLSNAPANITGCVNGGWQLQFIPSTAASLGISGRVTTAGGQGIRNAQVIVTGNSLTEPRVATTGSFGYYSFEGLEAGETYVVTVNSRRYTFTMPSRVISLIDNVADADFIADPQE